RHQGHLLRHAEPPDGGARALQAGGRDPGGRRDQQLQFQPPARDRHRGGRPELPHRRRQRAQAGMGEGRPHGRPHRRCLGAGSAGRGRDREAQAARTGRGGNVARPSGNDGISLAAGAQSRPRRSRGFIAGTREHPMAVPFFKEVRLGAYLVKQKLAGRKRYPLVLMLEPLFRCNLACAGCGKIDYPDAILNRRMSVQECLDAVDECGAPMVAIPGGEPLIHKEIGEIVAGIVARRKFVSLCTNALLLEKKLHLFTPSPYLFFSVHLDGLKEHHDRSVCQEGVFDRAVSAIKAAKAKGFTVNVNCTIFDNHPAEEIARFLDFCSDLGVGVSISPGYAYERAPDQEHFLHRRKTKELFRDVFAGRTNKRWTFLHSNLFLDFLAGNQEFHCTPWGMPTRNIFGWQKPCYLLGEGYARTYRELMETPDWDSYGTGRYEKCANCMAHCGYEPTAAHMAVSNPLKVIWVALRGIRTRGPMAPEIALDRQRPAQYVFSEQVQQKLSE